jgi:hypothetical protein
VPFPVIVTLGFPNTRQSGSAERRLVTAEALVFGRGLVEGEYLLDTKSVASGSIPEYTWKSGVRRGPAGLILMASSEHTMTQVWMP